MMKIYFFVIFVVVSVFMKFSEREREREREKKEKVSSVDNLGNIQSEKTSMIISSFGRKLLKE